MSDDKLNKDVFEAHMTQIHKNMDAMNANIVKLFERQDEMNIVLTKNTVVVKEHHARSNRLEVVVEDISNQFVQLGKQFIEFKTEISGKVDEIEEDLEPVQTHIQKVQKTFGFLETLPSFLKTVLLVLTIASSSIGLFTIVKDLIYQPVKIKVDSQKVSE